MKRRKTTKETLGDFGYIRWTALAVLLTIGFLANALVISNGITPAAAQAPPGETELVSDPDEIVERDDDGSFTARPVFDQTGSVAALRHPRRRYGDMAQRRLPGAGRRAASPRRLGVHVRVPHPR